jgi:hypothetical protein
MTERKIFVPEFKPFELPIDGWSKEARGIIKKYGIQSIVADSDVAELEGIPLLSWGAYTCYSGVALAQNLRTYVFHLYENDTLNQLKLIMGSAPLFGFVGGEPHDNIPRVNPPQFIHSPLHYLHPNREAHGGFNLIVLPNRQILYSAGYFDRQR